MRHVGHMCRFCTKHNKPNAFATQFVTTTAEHRIMVHKNEESARISRCRRYHCLLAFLLSLSSSSYGLSFGQGLLKGRSTWDSKVVHDRGMRRSRPKSKSTEQVLYATNRRKPDCRTPAEDDAAVALSRWTHWRNLSVEEEKELCGQIVEHRRIQELQVMLESRECRPVSVHEWALAAGYPSSHQLLGALQDGRKAERNILICHHALVRSVAHRYQSVSSSLSMEDMVQEGRMGLLKAVEHFNPSKGARFSSYAVFRIKAYILRAIADKDRLVRVPVHAQDTALRILAISHTLEVETGLEPTDAQLALALTMPEETVSLYRRSMLRGGSERLDPNLCGSKDGSLSRTGDGWPWDATHLAGVDMIRKEILKVMRDCLSPVEERALRLRYGLGDDGQSETARTFKEIGRMMELSGEGIRKMVARATQKLQDSEEARSLLMAYADGA